MSKQYTLILVFGHTNSYIFAMLYIYTYPCIAMYIIVTKHFKYSIDERHFRRSHHILTANSLLL